MLRGLPASIILHGGIVSAWVVAWPYIAPEREVREEVIIPITIDMQLDATSNFAPIVSRRVIEPEEDIEVPAEEDPEVFEEDSSETEIAEDEIDTTDVREQQEAPAPEEESDFGEKVADEEDVAEKETPADAVRNEPDAFEDFLGQNAELFSEKAKTSRPPPKRPEKKILVDETQVATPQAGVGDPSRNTVQVIDLITNKLKTECWQGVADLPNPERLVVSMRIKITDEGKPDGEPVLLAPSSRPVGDRPMATAIQRAFLAVRKCEYNLPEGAVDTYEEWKSVVINFDINS